MTPAALAERLDGRPAGQGRWQARCPAHDDRSPSLSIAEGDGGRVLLHCWAGCEYCAIVAALRARGIEVGAPTSPAERRRVALGRRMREQAEAAARRRQRKRTDGLRASDTTLDAVAARLAAVLWAGAPGHADSLAESYHALLDAQRATEVAA